MKHYTDIVHEKLKQGYVLSGKQIVNLTGCNNPFNVIYLLRRRFGSCKFESKILKNDNTGKKFAVYFMPEYCKVYEILLS